MHDFRVLVANNCFLFVVYLPYVHALILLHVITDNHSFSQRLPVLVSQERLAEMFRSRTIAYLTNPFQIKTQLHRANIGPESVVGAYVGLGI